MCVKSNIKQDLHHTDVNLMFKKKANHLCWDLLTLIMIRKFELIWDFM